MNTQFLQNGKPNIAALARRAVRGIRRSICMGRSRHVAGAGSNTPIVFVAGDESPKLDGQPYLKTGFSNGRGFSITLYTPSTLRIVVGAEWNPFAAYDNDNH